MARWFTASTYFGHANVIQFCDRRLADDVEMNELTRARHERFLHLYEEAGFRVHPELVVHDDERMASIRAVDEGPPIVHGHFHESFAEPGGQLNVGVHVCGLIPVSETELAAWIEELE